MVDNASEQRNARNGFTEAMDILNFTLPGAFVKDGGSNFGQVQRRILDDIYSPMLEDADFTESTLKDAIKAVFDSGGNVDIVEEAVAYCVFAVRAFFIGDDMLSWSYACDARRWGTVVTVAQRRNLPQPGALLAQIRHQKTRREHEKVADYWRSNIDAKLSAQKAADCVLLAGVTSLSHKKIAEIISPLRKAELIRKK